MSEQERNELNRRAASFRYAFEGWLYVLRTQRNAWIHAAASIMVISFSIWLKLDITEWLFIIISIAFVWTAEFVNTALEVVVDLATKEQHPLAKAGKDVGAAAVMIASLTSLIIGVLVLGPKLWDKFFQ